MIHTVFRNAMTVIGCEAANLLGRRLQGENVSDDAVKLAQDIIKLTLETECANGRNDAGDGGRQLQGRKADGPNS